MYQVRLTAAAAEIYNTLHPDIRKQIKASLAELIQTPHLGKALQNELIGFRSSKIKRYRVVYQVDDPGKTVIIYAVGHRRDIYEVITGMGR
jgi:mRNA interferase RelE/StbE